MKYLCIKKFINLQNKARSSSGCRCPVCNNRKKFSEEMKQHGIYVPHAESTWESEENFYRFSELEEEFVGKECNAEVCWSNRGKKASDAELELVKCGSCGGESVHPGCVGLKHGQVYTCCTCRTCGGQEATGKLVSGCLEKLLLTPEREPGVSLQEEEVHEEATERRQISLRGRISVHKSRSLKRSKVVP